VLEGALSARRHLNGRGGLHLGGNRQLLPPTQTILKLNVFKDERLGLTDADRRCLRTRVAFAIDKILKSTGPFCSHPGEKLRIAVGYLEDCVPRLAVCDSSWGACAVLSRSLRNRQPLRPRAAAAGAPTARAPTAGAPTAGAPTAGDDCDAPVQATQEQQLAQEQLDFLNQLL